MQSPWQPPQPKPLLVHLHSKFRENQPRTVGGVGKQTNKQTDIIAAYVKIYQIAQKFTDATKTDGRCDKNGDLICCDKNGIFCEKSGDLFCDKSDLICCDKDGIFM